jgi:putative intracellular protease/amidase
MKVTTNSKAFNLKITDAKEEDVVFCVGEQGSTGLAENTIEFQYFTVNNLVEYPSVKGKLVAVICFLLGVSPASEC